MKDKEQSVFPVSEHAIPSGHGGAIDGKWRHMGGLTKREYFAAMAMQGLCASLHDHKDLPLHAARHASDAISIADALIKELAKP